jgi:flavin reductase (DIM6/NTAB) family NADH-FMN oxidoreductase RutF
MKSKEVFDVKTVKNPSTFLFPVPTVLVTAVDAGGRPNVLTIAWTGVVCSEPPMVSVAIQPPRYSHSLITHARDFVINIPSAGLLRAVDACGLTSGREADKFAANGLTPVAATRVKAPLIQECPVNLECEVRQVLSLGTHDLFLAEVVAVHVEEAIQNEKGRIDFSKMQPFSFNNGEYWTLGEKLGSLGFSRKK